MNEMPLVKTKREFCLESFHLLSFISPEIQLNDSIIYMVMNLLLVMVYEKDVPVGRWSRNTWIKTWQSMVTALFAPVRRYLALLALLACRYVQVGKYSLDRRL